MMRLRPFLLVILIICRTAWAQTENPEIPGTESDDEIFTEADTVKDSGSLESENINEAFEKESLSLSGSINSRNSYVMSRDFLYGNGSTTANTLSNFIQLNGIAEARIRDNFKGIVNFTSNIYAQGTTERRTQTNVSTGATTQVDETVYHTWRFNEAFIDANIAQRIYFRAGRQVLIWGKGLFWNPTDIIISERRSFTDAFQIRQGTYGLKTHIPIGTVFNFYAFTGVSDSKKAEDISQALKTEFLIGRTEFAFSVVFGNGKVPVYGAEASTRYFTLDWRAEGTASYGDNQPRITYTENFPLPAAKTYLPRDTWFFKGVLGFGRSFELLDVSDRLTVNLEYFFNDSGYEENIFSKHSFIKGYFVQNNLYTPNFYGKHYLGVFTSVRKFFHPELTLNVSTLGNLQHESYILSESFVFTPLFNFNLTWQNNFFLGKADTEYTTANFAWYTELAARLTF